MSSRISDRKRRRNDEHESTAIGALVRLSADNQGAGKTKKPRGASGFYGVTAVTRSSRWCAAIRHNGQKQNLGTFSTREEAALAYDRAARERLSLSTPASLALANFNYPTLQAGEAAVAEAQICHRKEEAQEAAEKARKKAEKAEQLARLKAEKQAAKQAARQAKAVEKEALRNKRLYEWKVRRKAKSGFFGVHSKYGGRWCATLAYGGKNNYLGGFDTKEEAAHAYDQRARQHRKDLPLNYNTAEEGAAAAAAAAARHARETGAKHTKPRGATGGSRAASGFYGVSKTADGQRWVAYIHYTKEDRHHLGTFDTKERAAYRYDEAARAHSMTRPDVPLNFESEEAGAVAVSEAEARYAQEAASKPAPKRLGKSGYHGVTATKGENRWQAQIWHSGKQNYLGHFTTKEEAARAYDEAVREHQHQDVRASAHVLNFPTEAEVRARTHLATAGKPSI